MYCLESQTLYLLSYLNNFFIAFQFQLQSEFNLLLINLIVVELLVSTLGLPFDGVAAYQQGWKMGDMACQVVGFTLTFLGRLKFLHKINLRKFDYRNGVHDVAHVYFHLQMDHCDSKGTYEDLNIFTT